MDIATLGYAVDTSQLKAGTAALEQHGAAAERVAGSTGELTTSSKEWQAALAATGGNIKQTIAYIDALHASQQQLGVSQQKIITTQQIINQTLGVKSDFGGAARARDIEAYGKSLDDLRMKFNPLYAAGQRYKQTLDEIRSAAKVGAISEAEQAAAIERTKTAFASQVGTIRSGASTVGQVGNAAKLSTFQLQNMSYQMQDLGQAMLTGQPVFRTLIQQGSQMSQIFGPGVGVGAALRATGGALLTFVTNPLTLAVLGFAAAAAGAQALIGVLGNLGGSSVDAALKDHEERIKQIRALWDESTAAVDRYGEHVQTRTKYADVGDRENLVKAAQKANEELDRYLANTVFNNRNLYANPALMQLKGIYDQFHVAVVNGKGDVNAFIDQIEKAGIAPGASASLRRYIDLIESFTGDAEKATNAIKELNKSVKEVSVSLDGWSYLQLRAFTQGMNAVKALAALEKEHAATMAGIGARSPQELADAERRRVLARPLPPTANAAATRQREADIAAEEVYAKATQKVAQAEEDRRRAMDASVAAAQNQLKLIGLGIGAQTELQKQYELTAAAEDAAYKAGVEVSQAELDKIKATSAAFGRLADQAAKLKIVADIKFNTSLLGLSDEDVKIATQLRSIYGDDVPRALASSLAAAIRLGDRLKDINQIGKDFTGAFGSALEQVFNGSIKSADDFFNTLTKGIADVEAKFISSKLVDWFNGGANPFAGVKAANDNGAAALNTSAANLKSVGPTLTSAASALTAAANALKAAVSGVGTSSVTGGSPAGSGWFGTSLPTYPPIDTSGGGKFGSTDAVKAYIAQAALARGIDPRVALAVVQQESSFNIKAIGDSGTSFGLFQLHNAPGGGALGDLFTKITGINARASETWQKQVDFALDEANRLGWQPWLTTMKKLGLSKWSGISGTGAPASISATGGPVPSAVNDNRTPVNVTTPNVNLIGSGGLGTNLQNFLRSPGVMSAVGGFAMGYQQQSPIMGGFSGAIGGFMQGGLLGGVIGGIGGLLGGIFGHARAEAEKARQAAEAAQQAWDQLQPEVEKFKAQAAGPVGDLVANIDGIREEADKLIEAAKKAGKSTFDLENARDNAINRQIVLFRKGFGATLADLNAGLGFGGAGASAVQNILSIGDTLDKFLQDVGQAYPSGRNSFEPWIAGGASSASPELISARQAAIAYVKSLAGIGPELTDVQLAMVKLQARAGPLQAELVKLGLGAEEAAVIVKDGLGAQLAKLKTDFETGLQAQINSATGKGWVNQINDLQKQLKDNLTNASLLGTDLALVYKAYDAQVQKVIDDSGLVGDAFDEFIKLFPELAGVVHQSATVVNDAVKSINDYLESLKTGTLSTLSPQQQLNAAQSSFNAQIALAQGGNADALGSITNYADTLLQKARDFYASNADYAAIYTAVTAALQGLSSHLSGYASGGVVTNGIRGRDSVMAQLAGGEYVIPTYAVNSGTKGFLDYISQTGRPPANDNGETVMVLKSGFSMLAQSVSDMTAEIADLRSAVEQNASALNLKAIQPRRPGTKRVA